MAEYAFETITAEQALAFSSADSITFGVSAKSTSVLFNADGTFTIVTAARSVVFGAEVQFVSGSRITFSDGSLLYIGSANADVRDYSAVVSSSGAMYAGAGADTLTTSRGDWLVQGNQGADRIIVNSEGSQTIYGGQDDDTVHITSQRGAQFVQGNRGNDSLQSGAGADTLLGGQGNDRIFGGGGVDFINGNLGNDILEGGGQLFGEGGDDFIRSSAGVDNTVSGGNGDDEIIVGSATGLANRNLVTGGGGADTITASSDTIDTLSGDDGNDRIAIIQNASSGALSSAKILDGGAGDDTLIGRASADVLLGGAGADALSGGGGADRIVGGPGVDTLAGGAGPDRFEMLSPATSLTLAGADRITDWTSEDQIALRMAGQLPYEERTEADFDLALSTAQSLIGAGSAEVVAVQVGGDVVIFADASTVDTVDVTLVLVGRSLADIASTNFV